MHMDLLFQCKVYFTIRVRIYDDFLMYIVDHKVQNVQKQVVVTSDKPDVIEEICQELKQSKHRIAALVIFFIESNISL